MGCEPGGTDARKLDGGRRRRRGEEEVLLAFQKVDAPWLAVLPGLWPCPRWGFRAAGD